MGELTTGTVPVPGARLYYELRGAGPVLLMIAGAGGDAGYFASIAGLLADRHTVLTYDRRGNSRSRLTGPAGDLSVAEQADDASRLFDALGVEQAEVFGSSGGAIIGLDLVARHPLRVRTLVAHEPPILALLPEAAEHRVFFDRLQDAYRSEGLAEAARIFFGSIGQEPKAARDWDLSLIARVGGNLKFLLRHEIGPFIRYLPDLAALSASPVPVVLAGGRSSREYYYCRAGVALAERLGAPYVEFPGHHNAYLDHPAAFAATLHDALTTRRPGVHSGLRGDTA
ncbi:alpha/beta fold hydrolase [Solihabitans fulvus]|uniref:Alpha/beta fold hydrolase n=1 Tax=Solihabitans fulvus TaxID=1892852 RepID=A0A5B2XD48_9PSEU|nr:alpha/beta hydrolase [Solihabitans fulvus]KAA2261263.1 alpha/beta fold hydrolase [Solihabitans fulvus]